MLEWPTKYTWYCFVADFSVGFIFMNAADRVRFIIRAPLQNELIDALECLASLAIMSGMGLEEKIR